jgi:hypothetical protein
MTPTGSLVRAISLSPFRETIFVSFIIGVPGRGESLAFTGTLGNLLKHFPLVFLQAVFSCKQTGWNGFNAKLPINLISFFLQS